MAEPQIIHLEEGLHRLRTLGTERYQRIAGEGFRESFTPKDFMELNTTVYQMCTQDTQYLFTQELYDEYGNAVERYVREVVLGRLDSKHDQFLLQTLVLEYQNFKVYIRMMKNVFEYLNRFYVPRNGKKKLQEVGIIKFDEVVFTQPVGSEIRKAALALIQLDREGEKVDRQLIRDITTIYVDLGSEEEGNEKYETCFQEFFLKDTHTFYSTKSAEWLQESLPEYLIKVENALQREQKLREDCLPECTKQVLQKKLEEELLVVHQKTLLERETGGFSSLLTDMRVDDLRRMYDLFSRITDGLKPLASQFCSFVTKKGRELVETFEPAKAGSAEAVMSFVNNLIDMHDAYDRLLKDCFANSGLFNKAMKEAFESFVNREMGPSGSKTMCAELLSSYCDTLLKSSGEKMSDSALEDTLEKVVKLFTYLSDKDLFSEYYRKQLARRLLQKKSASDDAEFRMLEMLKRQCGAQFTSKLEGMVKDLTLSKEHQQHFREFMDKLPADQKPSVECEVQVLTTGFWPSYPILELHLPDELSRCIQLFTKFYSEITKHRLLKWLHTMGQVTLQAQYSKRYDLIVSTPQAAILMLFNATEQISFDQVRTRLNLTKEEATRQLLTLSAGKFRLLKKEPAGKTIAPDDMFLFNAKFSADKKRIKVPTISSKELSKEDKESTSQVVAEDRKHAIEAAIVRIMKARKQLEFQKLVLETSQQLIRLFRPDVKLIKARMEDLITREYLERDPDNPKILRYLA